MAPLVDVSSALWPLLPTPCICMAREGKHIEHVDWEGRGGEGLKMSLSVISCQYLFSAWYIQYTGTSIIIIMHACMPLHQHIVHVFG